MHNRNKTSKGQQPPLISLTIDLGHQRSDRIAIYHDTNPYFEAKQFGQRNHLSQQTIQVIADNIIKQMSAYDEILKITYDTESETSNLHKLKMNHLQMQKKSNILSTPSPIRSRNNNQSNGSRKILQQSPSNQHFDDILTDKVVVKRLFQLLDSDLDGLISINKVQYSQISNTLKNKIQQILNVQVIPLEFEEFYLQLKQDNQDEYFSILKQISQIFDIQKIKVLIQ